MPWSWTYLLSRVNHDGAARSFPGELSVKAITRPASKASCNIPKNIAKSLWTDFALVKIRGAGILVRPDLRSRNNAPQL
jgi:hypothetical protein